MVFAVTLMASFAICRTFSSLVEAATEFTLVDGIVGLFGFLVRTSRLVVL